MRFKHGQKRASKLAKVLTVDDEEASSLGVYFYLDGECNDELIVEIADALKELAELKCK